MAVQGIDALSAFWESVEKILKTNNATNLSDYHAIKDMISKEKFILYESNFWYDTGNIDSTVFGTGKFFEEKNVEKKENIYSNVDDMLNRSLKTDD